MTDKIKRFFYEEVQYNCRMQRHHGMAHAYWDRNSRLAIIFPFHILYRIMHGVWFFLVMPNELPFERDAYLKQKERP